MINNILRLSLPILICLWAVMPALGASILIENASFEFPEIDLLLNPFGAQPDIDNWIETDLDTLGSQNTGVFVNTEPNNINFFGDHDHIFNADGKQMAFLGSQAGNALEQDLSATYNIGCDYRLTVAVGTSFMYPPSTEEPMDYLELVLYYSDGNEPVDILSLPVPATDPNQWLEDFSLYLPIIAPDDPWAGATIGIAIRATGRAGGFWDLDNVRLEEYISASLYIENASFEFPEIDILLNPFGAQPDIESWTEMDLDNLGSQNTGVFVNTEPNNVNFFGDHDHIFNADGKQMAFLGSQTGNALEQDLSAIYNIGCDYRLTVAVGTSFMYPPSTEEPMDYLELVFHYSDGNEPVDIVSLPVPAMDPNQWLEDFSLYLPTIAPDDPWAGKNIGIAIRAAGKAGGFWDLDNVRLNQLQPSQDLLPINKE